MRPPTDVPRGRDYLSILHKGWSVIFAATLVSVGAAYLAHVILPPEYTASASVFAVVPGAASVRAAFEGDRASASRMTSYGELAKSRQVAGRTIAELQLPTTSDELAERVTVTVVPESVLLELNVTGSDADQTRDTVNALARNLVQVSQEVVWSDTGPATDLMPVDFAQAAHDGRAPLWRHLAEGGALGLFLSVALVLAVGLIRSKVDSKQQADYIALDSISPGGNAG